MTTIPTINWPTRTLPPDNSEFGVLCDDMLQRVLFFSSYENKSLQSLSLVCRRFLDNYIKLSSNALIKWNHSTKFLKESEKNFANNFCNIGSSVNIPLWFPLHREHTILPNDIPFIEDKAKTPAEILAKKISIACNYHKNHFLKAIISSSPDISELSTITSLNLKGFDITILPPEIKFLTNVTALNLSGNSLQFIPSEIALLTSLKELDLSHNGIEYFPLHICHIPSLVFLELNHTPLEHIPDDIQKLKSLSSLHLHHNKFKEFPPQILKLVNLRHLDIYAGDISELPLKINSLVNLLTLNLSYNPINTLPPTIGDLHKLLKLYLTKTKIKNTNLPHEICNLKTLLVLHTPEIYTITKKNTQQALKNIRNQLLPNTQTLTLSRPLPYPQEQQGPSPSIRQLPQPGCFQYPYPIFMAPTQPLPTPPQYLPFNRETNPALQFPYAQQLIPLPQHIGVTRDRDNSSEAEVRNTRFRQG